jgi:hypothetical protein
MLDAGAVSAHPLGVTSWVRIMKRIKTSLSCDRHFRVGLAPVVALVTLTLTLIVLGCTTTTTGTWRAQKERQEYHARETLGRM